MNQPTEQTPKRRGRPPMSVQVQAPEPVQDAPKQPEPPQIHEFPGLWECKRIGSVGMIYASFDTKQQFWVEFIDQTNETAKITLLDPITKEQNVVIVEHIKNAKPDSVRAYWPSRQMDRSWLYNGKNPFYGAFPRPEQSKPLMQGMSTVSISTGKV